MELEMIISYILPKVFYQEEDNLNRTDFVELAINIRHSAFNTNNINSPYSEK